MEAPSSIVDALGIEEASDLGQWLDELSGQSTVSTPVYARILKRSHPSEVSTCQQSR